MNAQPPLHDRQAARLDAAVERVHRVRGTELDTLADLVAGLDDRTAARFAAMHQASADTDNALREFVTAARTLTERLQLASGTARSTRHGTTSTHTRRHPRATSKPTAPQRQQSPAPDKPGGVPLNTTAGTGEGSACGSAHPPHAVCHDTPADAGGAS